MSIIKKALDVLSKTENPIIKNDMICELRKQFTHLENSTDTACEHNEELIIEVEQLEKTISDTRKAIKAAFGNEPVACDGALTTSVDKFNDIISAINT